jgi:hypothetical protein
VAGSDWMNSDRSTTSRWTLCTLTTGVSARTTICSCRLPTRISAGIVSVADPVISMSSRMTVENPVSVNATR